MIRKRLVPALALAVTVIAITGCPKKKPETTAPSSTTPTLPAQPTEPTTPPKTEVGETFPKQPVDTAPLNDPSVDELNNRLKPLQTVHFQYDSSDLDDSNRAILQQNADWLKKNTKRTIRIEGHADERGTIKYNIALGERRANSVREYLEGLGVAGSRIRIVSFGEEKPANPGHDEGSWQQNRRAEFWFES